MKICRITMNRYMDKKKTGEVTKPGYERTAEKEQQKKKSGFVAQVAPSVGWVVPLERIHWGHW